MARRRILDPYFMAVMTEIDHHDDDIDEWSLRKICKSSKRVYDQTCRYKIEPFHLSIEWRSTKRVNSKFFRLEKKSRGKEKR